MTTKQNEREPSEAEMLIANIATNDRQKADERATVREAAEALDRSGRVAYAAMVASIADDERKKIETTIEV